MKTPRPYQTEALAALRNKTLQATSEPGKTLLALIEMATGLGKTALIAMFARWWIESGQGSTILFVMHMAEPLYQARKEFREALYGLNTPLGLIVGTEREHIDAPVLFTTFQSLAGLIHEIPADDFSLVIVDEAHHAYAPSYHKVIKHFQPTLRCGMTATVDRMDRFDVRDLFGSPLYSYPLTKALAHGGYLANIDYRVMVEKVNEENILHLRRRIVHGDGMVTLKMINQGVFLHADFEPIAKIVREEQQRGNKKTIVFCHSIAHIRQFERLFPEGKAYHTQVPPHILESRLEAFRKGTLRMIFVRDMFNEAMDIPDAELVVFLRSTASRTIWLQQLGRGLRTSAGKNHVTVLDFVANCQRLMNVYGLAEEVEKLEKEEFAHHGKAEKGIRVTYSHEMQKILDLIQLLRKRFYPTWIEASRAVRALGFKTADDYRANFNKDPRLPPSPVRFYSEEWNAKGGWGGFLGVTTAQMLQRKREQRVLNRIPFTYEEAARFIQMYGFRDEKTYAKEFRNMSLRLPEFPQIVYKDVWEKNGGWDGFLTKKKPQTDNVHGKVGVVHTKKEG